MKTSRLLTLVLLLLLPAARAAEESPFEPVERLFTLKVLPLISHKCFGCHDPSQEVKGGLDMSTREALLRGGEEFKNVLVPGSAERSFIMTAVTWADPDYEMPPKENDRLNEQEIEQLASWINAGAPWPDGKRQREILLDERSRPVTDEGVLITTSGGQADAWTYRRYKPDAVWAFRALKQPPVPGPAGAHPVDAFIGEKIKQAGFEPAPPAELRRLIRRASFDLIGLPPSPKEIEAFLDAAKQDRERAWTELIDRLLASPHYGERWGQHWLDVARYADTAGLSNDYERSNAWRYRDYVIRAFNEDKSYQDFILEQLAGDEMADASLRKRFPDEKAFKEARDKGACTAEESELLVASSFLRMGPWDPAMVKAPQARQQFIDDVVNAVGQTFLSTTMRCFKCHDHKFDPLPTRDYYRIYAVFAGTQVAERPAPFLPDENKMGFQESKQEAQVLLRFASRKFGELKAKIKETELKWYTDRNLEFVPQDKRKGVPDEEKPPRLAGLSEVEKGRHKVRQQDEWIWTRRLERYQPLVQSVYNAPDPSFLNARKLRMSDKHKDKPAPDCRILSGGALEAPGEPVTPGVLSALGVPTEKRSDDDPYKLSEDLTGRRLGLARWIADERNPLTARSIVNRVWQYHFGKGLAGNANNFGGKGARPTHPELLDWLAADFVKNGWKMKRLHRLIMSSATYQQDGLHPRREALANRDANNDLFAYFPSRRLSAEELLDGMLRITGELNTTRGGLPIKPEMNMEVALEPRMIQFSIAPTYLPSPTPEQRNRRSIYAYRVRGLAHPFLETFNQPNPNDSCESRDAAAVTPQAFTLMNSDLVTDRSIAFALRLERDVKTLPVQVNRAFKLALGRAATPPERERMLAYVKEMQAYHRATPAEPRAYPTEITRSLVEEFSGQPFQYREILPVFKNYQRDRQAADVSPETRALADFCLLLFNCNEFVYVY